MLLNSFRLWAMGFYICPPNELRIDVSADLTCAQRLVQTIDSSATLQYIVLIEVILRFHETWLL
jgi:hypothetical protein